MQKKTARSRIFVVLSFALAFVLAATLLPIMPHTAVAVTSAEKQAEADAMVAKLDALQTELSAIRARYDEAVLQHDTALILMEDARLREEEATAQITALQAQLGDRAVAMYRHGGVSYLDVLFGATSFSEFISSWDMMNRVSASDAVLVQEAKDAKEAAEEAKQLYTEQERIAAEKQDEVAEIKAELEAQQRVMQEEIAYLTWEAAELLAQEEAAAEAARLKAEEDARRAAMSGGSVDVETAGRVPGMIHPCPGAPISSNFGWRSFDNSYHMGLDLAASTGTPIYAAAAGTVIISGYSGSAGNWIVITHGGGIVTKYMHASALYVSAGTYVEQGQHIAAVGNTGNSFGAHLHFQVEVDGQAVNPYPFIY